MARQSILFSSLRQVPICAETLNCSLANICILPHSANSLENLVGTFVALEGERRNESYHQNSLSVGLSHCPNRGLIYRPSLHDGYGSRRPMGRSLGDL
jgi:hypothetical protein